MTWHGTRKRLTPVLVLAGLTLAMQAVTGLLLGTQALAHGGPPPGRAAPRSGEARVWDDGQVYREMGTIIRSLHGLRKVPEARLPAAAERAAHSVHGAWPQVGHTLRRVGYGETAARFEAGLDGLTAAVRGRDAAEVQRALGRALAELRAVQEALSVPVVDGRRLAASAALLAFLSAGWAWLFYQQRRWAHP